MTTVDQLAQVVLQILFDQKTVPVQNAAELMVVGNVVFWGGTVQTKLMHVAVVELDGSFVESLLRGALVVVDDGFVAVGLQSWLNLWQP